MNDEQDPPLWLRAVIFFALLFAAFDSIESI
jgi:hypothetical protein